MKKLILAIAALVTAFSMSSAFAANDNKDLTVTINLAPKCEMTTPNALVFNYTSFAAALVNATGGDFTIRCTTDLPYKVGFDATATPATTKNVAAAAGNLQLAYDLGLSGTTTGNGTGLTAIDLSVTGTMAANQSGTCANPAGCTANQTHTIYVVY